MQSHNIAPPVSRLSCWL